MIFLSLSIFIGSNVTTVFRYLAKFVEGGQNALLTDCIVLKITGSELAAMRAGGVIDWKKLIPVRSNIETVVEMKFAGDKLSVAQRNAYRKIAGPSKFRLLEMGDCDCGNGRKRPATEPVRVPVTTPLLFLPPEPRGPLGGKPIAAPVPQPVRPQYGPVVPVEESTALSSVLKGALVVGGVIVIGAIVIVAAPEIAIGTAVMALGRGAIALISLAVATSAPARDPG